MTRGRRIAALAVGLHVVANAAHGVPHQLIPVTLAAWQSAFVFVVVLLAPLAGLGLVWRGATTSGAVLLAASMAASLAFGLTFHFAVSNPDHVHAVPAGPWHDVFGTTAVLVALVDAAGVAAGVRLAVDGPGAESAAEA